MREKQLKLGRAWRVSVVAVATLATLAGTILESGTFGQKPVPSPRGRRMPVNARTLIDLQRQADWTTYSRTRTQPGKGSRILRQFPLTEFNITPVASSNPWTFTSDETDTAWSPSTPGSSGAFIAVSSNRPTVDSSYHIYRMNRDGTSVFQVTANNNFNPALNGQREPAWNPQAPNKIVFVAPDPYLPPPSPPYTLNPAVTQTDLFVIDVARPVAIGTNPVRIPLPLGGIKRNPRYLADGITIVFASNTDVTAANDANTPLPGGFFNLFTCDETGIAANRTRVTNVAANDTFPAPSSNPITPLVLFTSDRTGVGPGPRHIWGVRLTATHVAQGAPFQVTGTATLTTNSGAPAEEFHPDWHDPQQDSFTASPRANMFFFASTRNDANGCATTHSSIWSLDVGAAQTLTEVAATATAQIVSIQPPLPPAGVAPYDPNVARCADNLRPSASHAINLVGGTDLVAFSSNRTASSFDIWRTNIIDSTPPVLVPVNIGGAAYPVMAPGVPNDGPGTLVVNGSQTPRTPNGGLTNNLTIACVVIERESGLQRVRAVFRDLDYDKTSGTNFDGCYPSALGDGNSQFFPFGSPERLDDFDNARLPPATERQAPTVGNPVNLSFFDNGPPSAGGNELQPGAVAGDGIFFCLANIDMAAQNIPSGRDYSIDIELTDNAMFARTAPPFIFDNIWGFSRRVFAPSTQILLVNDHMQGQAFLQQLGDIFPNEVLAAMPCESYWTTNPGGGLFAFEDTIADFGQFAFTDRAYDQWRVLSRGPIPITVLAAYTPTRETQFDPTSTLPLATRPAIQALVAEKCVLWGSPFAGNLITGTGTIEDPGTQQTIRNFIGLGGRILFSGRDIGFALTQNGAQPNNDFFANVLKATFVSDSNTAAGLFAVKQVNSAANRTFFDGPWVATVAGDTTHYGLDLFPFDTTGGLQLAIDNYPPRGMFCYTANPPAPRTAGDAWRGDLMNTAVTTQNLLVGELLFLDSILPRASTSVFEYGNGQTAGVRFDDATNNSSVAYLAFGLEMIHREYRAAADPRPDRCLNMRAKVLHNIACSFRTCFAFGTIVDAGNNQPLPSSANIRIEIFEPGTPDRIVAVSRLAADGSGRWEVHALPPSAPGVLFVRAIPEDSNYFEHPAPGLNLGYSHGGFNVLNNGTLNFRLTPSPPGSITGRVVDQLNNPVGGVRVFAEMIPPTGSGLNLRRGASLLTDNQGNYSIPGLPQGPAGTRYRLFYNLYTRNRLNAGFGDDITSSISPLRAFGEALRDDANAPSVTNDNPPPATVPQLIPQGAAVTVTSGQATPVGDTILQAAPGDIAGIVRNAVNAQAITTTPVRISLSAGTPPSFSPTNPPIVPTPAVPARTDGGNQSATDGYYEFAGIPANSGAQQYRVTGLALGFDRGILDLAVASGRIMARGSGGAFTDTLNLTPLANPGTVTGQVRRLDDNAGIVNATVTLLFQGAGATAASTLATTTSNATGTYTFNGVFPTLANEFFQVTAIKTNFLSATSSQFSMAAGQTQTVNLSLDPPGSVSGVVRIASTGLPVGGATVTVLDAQGAPLLNPDTPGLPFTATTTATVAADARSNNVQFNYRIKDLPPQNVQVRVTASGFSDQTRTGVAVPARGELNGQDVLLLPLKIYTQGLQMISHPFTTGGESIGTTLGVTPPVFRMARFNTAGNVFEEFGGAAFPSTQGFELGRGYFLLLNQTALNLTREGTALPTGSPFQITLFNGWNLVGYPYAPRGDFANGIDWLSSTIRTGQGGDQSINSAASAGIVRSGLFTFNGSGYSLASRMTPFGGFWVRSLQNSVTLLVSNNALRTQPTLRSSAKLSAFRNFVQRDGGTEGWAVGLVAQTTKAKDEASLIGSAANARDGYDAHDTETPPPVQMAPSLSVTFPHPDWGTNSGRYSVDIRGPLSAEKSWDFEVTSNEPNETVTLSWPGLNANLPRPFRATLIDLDSGQRKYLRTINSYAWTNQLGQPRRLRLEITASDDQRLLVQNLLANPTSQGRVQFSFVLSREAEISLGVLNAGGKLVESQALHGRTGLNTVHWSGADRRGARVPRGLYLLRVLATDPDTGQQIQQVKSMALK